MSWTSLLPRPRRGWTLAFLVASAGVVGCKNKAPNNGAPARAGEDQAPLSFPACKDPETHPGLAPNVQPAMLKAKYWIDKLGPEAARTILLSRTQIEAINLKIKAEEFGVRDLPEALTPDALKKQSTEFHQEQQAFVHQKLDEKKYVESIPGATKEADQRVLNLVPRDDYFAFTTSTQLRCWPIEGGMFKPPIDPNFDRNNCSTLQAPEVVHRIVSDSSDGWHYVQGRFVEGWVHDPKWQPISTKKVLAQARGRKRWISKDKVKVPGGAKLAMGSIVPVNKKGQVEWPRQEGWETLKLPRQRGVHRKPLPLRRDTLFKLIFSQIDRPYGWGGRAAERDCSRLLLDVFRVFGIELPRWSGHQSAIENSVDISMLSDKDKRATLRRFGQSNLLLLFMPGHIMLYLGSDGDRDYAISSISEYVTPCTSKDNTLEEQLHLLNRVTVTDLSLGKHSPRRSFLERITAMVRF